MENVIHQTKINPKYLKRDETIIIYKARISYHQKITPMCRFNGFSVSIQTLTNEMLATPNRTNNK